MNADRVAALCVARLELSKINVPHEDNPRVLPLRDSPEWKTLRASLEHDYFDPIIWNRRNGKLVSGHVRAPIMIELGFTHADVVVVDYDQATHKARMIAANAHSGNNDETKLEALLAELKGISVDPVLALLESLGEKKADKSPAEARMSYAEKLNEAWRVEFGDLWLIGGHRLFCGDCRDHDNMEKLMCGEKYEVTVVDPPFEFDDLPYLHDPCIVFGQAKHLRMIPPELWRFERVIDKVTAHRSATVQIGHRHAFVAQCGTVKRLPANAETYPSIVTCGERPDHRHQKPLELLIEHLTVWTPQWHTVFDPFLGSGTTMVAAEMMGRRCVGFEISPAFCAVIIDRMTRSFPKIVVERSS